MRISWIAFALLIGCQADLDDPASPGVDDNGTSEAAATDHLKEIVTGNLSPSYSNG